jgi:hypothetical protein
VSALAGLPPELARLLVEFHDAECAATAAQHRAVYSDAAEVDDAAFAPIEAAEKRARSASDALAAWTRAALSAPPDAPVDVERLACDLYGLLAGYSDRQPWLRATTAVRERWSAAVSKVVEHALSRTLATQAARVAELEARCATLRSMLNVRDAEPIVEAVNADLARRAAEWERMADDVAAANVEASARIAELEAEVARLTALVSLPHCDHVKPCTCGSGGHPRKCERHPGRFSIHCMELSMDSRVVAARDDQWASVLGGILEAALTEDGDGEDERLERAAAVTAAKVAGWCERAAELERHLRTAVAIARRGVVAEASAKEWEAVLTQPGGPAAENPER